jgi:RNA 3'-terminal phosphate cyclase-like protein
MKFKGTANFRSRIICSIISGESFTVRNLPSYGLAEYELKFLELVTLLTNGTIINVDEDLLEFTPGLITNQSYPIDFNSGMNRGIAYFIEGVLPIAVFGKSDLVLTITGKINDPRDVSIETIRANHIPMLKRFGVDYANLKRSGNSVTVELIPVRSLSPFRSVDPGKVKRIRGVVYSTRFNVQIVNRASHSCKGHLLNFTPDIWIHTDCIKLGTEISA